MMIGIFSVTMFVLAEALAQPLSYVFVGYDGELTNIAVIQRRHEANGNTAQTETRRQNVRRIHGRLRDLYALSKPLISRCLI